MFVDLSEGWYLEQLLPCLGKYNLIQIPQFICLAHDDRWTRFNMSQEGEPTSVRVKNNCLSEGIIQEM